MVDKSWNGLGHGLEWTEKAKRLVENDSPSLWLSFLCVPF